MADNIFVKSSEDAARVPVATDECLIDSINAQVQLVKVGTGDNAAYAEIAGGQKQMSASVPAVIASDQSGNATEGSIFDAAVLADAAGTMSAKLRGLVKWASERMPGGLGQRDALMSLPVTLASNHTWIRGRWEPDRMWTYVALSGSNPRPAGSDITVIDEFGGENIPQASDFNFALADDVTFNIPVADCEDIAICLGMTGTWGMGTVSLGAYSPDSSAGFNLITQNFESSQPPTRLTFVTKPVGLGASLIADPLPSNMVVAVVPGMVGLRPALHLRIFPVLYSGINITLHVTRVRRYVR